MSGLAALSMLVAELPAFERARTEILEHDVAAPHQLQKQLAAARNAQVERDRALVATEHRPVQRPSIGPSAPRCARRRPDRGSSTLMTSAPQSASSAALKGAAIIVAMSRTRSPASGPLTPVFRGDGALCHDASVGAARCYPAETIESYRGLRLVVVGLLSPYWLLGAAAHQCGRRARAGAVRAPIGSRART